MSSTAGPGTAGAWVVPAFPVPPVAGYAPGDIFVVPGIVPTIGVLAQDNAGNQLVSQVYPPVVPQDQMPRLSGLALTPGAHASALVNVAGLLQTITGTPVVEPIVQIMVSTPGGILSAIATVGTIVQVNEISPTTALITVQGSAAGSYNLDVEASAPGIAGWTIWCGPYVGSADSTAFP